MKRTLALLVVLCLALNSNAQTWDEWFQQKKTQIRYLLEQVSALKMYESAVRKGYDLVNGGLKDIGRLKEGDFILHQEHFASLCKVNKGVKDSKLLSRILSLQAAVQQIIDLCKRWLLKEGAFLSNKKIYFYRVFDNVLHESKAIIDEAVVVTTDNLYQMTDDERLKRLQHLAMNMEELYAFSRHFQNSLATAALHRLKEQQDTKRLKALY